MLNTKDDRPSEGIFAGGEELKNAKGITILEDWKRLPTKLGGVTKGWMIICEIQIESANEDLVPHKTNWCIGVDERYPNGEIEITPAKKGGLTKTFQHQYYNGAGAEGVPWRDGIICVKGVMFYLKVRGYDTEPFKKDERLIWHLKLARRWLEEASKRNLVGAGQYFELPDYATLDKKTRIVFCESWETRHIWDRLVGQYGIVEFGLIDGPKTSYITIQFKTKSGIHLYTPHWCKSFLKKVERKKVGGWFMLRKVAFLEPWQAPMTWDELMKILESQGIDAESVMRGISEVLREKDSMMVLMGLPISHWIGEDVRQIHWQAFRLYGLDSMCGSWMTKRKKFALRNARLDWIKSENWDETAIRNRGRFREELCDKRIVIVGVGSIGSISAELLTRGGVKDITIIDNDYTEIGNLCRHTLSMESVDYSKVKTMVDRIGLISPHVNVNEINAKIEDVPSEKWKYVEKANIILNCTGNDDVISFLEGYAFDNVKIFVSLAIGLGPKRLYVLVGKKKTYPGRFYQRHLNKWLEKDIKEYIKKHGEKGLPRSGGIGCWHPAFPARSDDMWLFTASGIKYLESYIRCERKDTVLAVFEMKDGKNGFNGIEIISEEWDNG